MWWENSIHTEKLLLASVPIIHLHDAMIMPDSQQKTFAFGSSLMDVFLEQPENWTTLDIPVLIYVSLSGIEQMPDGLFRRSGISVLGRYRGWCRADQRTGMYPSDGLAVRPPSTEADTAQILYWRVDRLMELRKSIPVTALIPSGKSKSYAATYVPRKPSWVSISDEAAASIKPV
jgi:hypothetical protein